MRKILEDPTRCQGHSKDGARCALDEGHYRGRIHKKPSPHVAENGTEWFQPRERQPPETEDSNRCHGRMGWGVRCALDIGHYPSPHVSEDGVEWFGLGKP